MDPRRRSPMQRRRVSPPVRRRRTLAVAILTVLTIVAILLTTSGSPNHRAKTVTKSALHTTHPIARIAAVAVPWLLPAPVSRAIAVVDGSGVSVMGGIDANQS